MSKTISISGGIYVDTGKYADPANPYKFFGGPARSWDEFVLVMPHVLNVQVPDDFDPRPAQIEGLEKQRDEMTAKYQAMVTEINARISKLQAITYEPGTTQGEPA